jgi:hypothetical protein
VAIRIAGTEDFAAVNFEKRMLLGVRSPQHALPFSDAPPIGSMSNRQFKAESLVFWAVERSGTAGKQHFSETGTRLKLD